MAEKEKKYRILPEYKGKTAWTVPPDYTRKDEGKFVLDDNLSDKDMGYLFTVIQYPGVEKVG